MVDQPAVPRANASRYRCVHTLHLWDPHLPHPDGRMPVTVVRGVSADDDGYLLRGVEFLRLDTRHPAVAGGVAVVTLRVPADGVTILTIPGTLPGGEPAVRVLILDRDFLVPAPSVIRGAKHVARWYDERDVQLNDHIGACYADVDVFVAEISMRRGASPKVLG